jgi:hypothetical protein
MFSFSVKPCNMFDIVPKKHLCEIKQDKLRQRYATLKFF